MHPLGCEGSIKRRGVHCRLCPRCQERQRVGIRLSAEDVAAVLFATATAFVVAFQLALALGAPWGSYAMGGAFSGTYPPGMRVAALVQAVILAAVAVVVLSAAGLVATPWGPPPSWAMWVIVGLLGVGLVLNLITPSAGERRIWAPTVGVMLVCAAIVAVGS